MSQNNNEGNEIEEFIDELYQRFKAIFENIKEIQQDIKLKDTENQQIQSQIVKVKSNTTQNIQGITEKLHKIEEKRKYFSERGNKNSDNYDRIDLNNLSEEGLEFLDKKVDRDIMMLFGTNVKKLQVLKELVQEENKFKNEINNKSNSLENLQVEANNNVNREPNEYQFWDAQVNNLLKVLGEKERVQSDLGLKIEELKASRYEQEDLQRTQLDEERLETTLMKNEARVHTTLKKQADEAKQRVVDLYKQNVNKSHRLKVLEQKNAQLKKKVNDFTGLKQQYETIVEQNWQLTDKVYQLQSWAGKPRYQMEQKMKGIEVDRVELKNVGTFIDNNFQKIIDTSNVENKLVDSLKKKVEDRNDLIYAITKENNEHTRSYQR